MEKDEKNIDKSKLLEHLKRQYATSTTANALSIIMFALAFVLIYLGRSDIKSVIPDLVLLSICLITVVHLNFWNRKLSKSDNGKTFLTTYDKYKKWDQLMICVIVMLILAFLILTRGFSTGLLKLVIFIVIGGIILYWISKGANAERKKDIELLRELEQQED